RHGHLEYMQHELRAFGVRQQEAVGAEEHGFDVQRLAGREARHGLQAQVADGFPAELRLHQHFLGRADHALAVQVQVGRQSIEGARAVEHHAGHPEGMVSRAEQLGVLGGPAAIMPVKRFHVGLSLIGCAPEGASPAQHTPAAAARGSYNLAWTLSATSAGTHWRQTSGYLRRKYSAAPSGSAPWFSSQPRVSSMAGPGTLSFSKNACSRGAWRANSAFSPVTTLLGLNSVGTGFSHLGSVMQV